MILTAPGKIEYPSSDGKPMAENTLQYRWITTIKGGLHALFRNRPDVFVAADLFWYPVEGDPQTRTAPDTLVVFGRPPGERPSYKQFEEQNIPPQVVFEVLSPSNDETEMLEKRLFYEAFGVKEYYVYDPDRIIFEVWLRKGEDDDLELVEGTDSGFTSPLLNVKFEIQDELVVTGPDGVVFVDYPELAAQRDELRTERDEFARQCVRATRKAEQSAKRAELEAKRAEDLNRKALEATDTIEQLKARLRALGDTTI